MFSEQFFDLLLNFGDNWKVERVYVNIVTDEVDVFNRECRMKSVMN